MNFWHFSVIFIVYYASVYSYSEEKLSNSDITSTSSSRQPKFLFGGYYPIKDWPTTQAPTTTQAPIISEPGPMCATTDGQIGQCLTTARCLVISGSPSATPCGFSGAETCCLIRLVAVPGELIVRQSFTTLTNIENGTGSGVATTFNIPRPSVDICQIKIEFKTFSISQPDRNSSSSEKVGNCTNEQLIVRGMANLDGPFIICGNVGADEHLFLHYGFTQISLEFNLNSPNSTYNVLVIMIRCDSQDAAPEGCTQFHTAMNGIVRSFNFPFQQLNNQTYSVCIRSANSPSSLATSIAWSLCHLNDPGEVDEFFISEAAAGVPWSGSDCIGNDRVTIPGSPNTTYCGGNFLPLISSVQPFTLFVEFDDMEGTTVLPPMFPGQMICPPNFVCHYVNVTQPGIPGQPCLVTEGGICVLDTELNPGILEDVGNTGFCLRYSKF